MLNPRKAQAWYMDFAIALLLFSFTVVIYFGYTNNFQKEEKGNIDDMVNDAKAISSSLALSGYPFDWDNTTVIRIGIADDQKINTTKLSNFKKMKYSTTRSRFATHYNYFVFFTNNNNDVLNINGICGVGHLSVNTSFNIKSAYYYQDDDDSFLKDFMINTFKADVYKEDIGGLANNLPKYQFLVMEHPLLSGSEFSNYKDTLENYSSRGNLLMLSGELAAPATNSMIGVDFKKKSGQSSSQRTAIVNNTDTYLSLSVGQSMVFNQYYYVENTTASQFKPIATFNQSNNNAIASWKYGNGTVYFFSDFDVSAFNGNFVGLVEDAAKSIAEGTCTPINLTGISRSHLVKAERYLNYNSNIVKMVVYVWQ